LSREADGNRQYLLQKRIKVPYRGYLADPGGKILFGEDVLAAANRNMLVETNLTCDLTVKGLVHFKDSYRGSVVQDKFFFVIKASDPVGELSSGSATGENLWLSLDEIAANPKTHQGLTDLIAMAEGDSFGFIERTHFVDEY
jgi:ADP-ribose pyrophosphatase YjhB (NUDIX family)